MNIDKSVVLAQHRLRSALNRDVNSRVLVEVIIPSIKRQIEAATNEHFRAPRWFDEAYKLDGDMYSTLLKNLDGQMVFSPAELLSIPEKGKWLNFNTLPKSIQDIIVRVGYVCSMRDGFIQGHGRFERNGYIDGRGIFFDEVLEGDPNKKYGNTLMSLPVRGVLRAASKKHIEYNNYIEHYI